LEGVEEQKKETPPESSPKRGGNIAVVSPLVVRGGWGVLKHGDCKNVTPPFLPLS